MSFDIIALSGKSGCGNTTVGRLVAEKTNYHFINYTFRNLAQEWDVSLAEVANQAKNNPDIDRLIDTKQTELARSENSVLSSRLAIWMLPEALLKVYLFAGEEVRISRILKREGGDLKIKKSETLKRDEEDSRRYQSLYGIRVDDYGFADIIINTENFIPEEIASIIFDAYTLKRGRG